MGRGSTESSRRTALGATVTKALQARDGRWLLAAAAAALLVAVAIAVHIIGSNYTTDLTAPGGALWDFRDAGYFPVRAVLDGAVPYDVGNYLGEYPVAQEFPLLPPTYLLIHSPFQLLGLNAAYVAIVIVNVGAAVALAWWCLKLSRHNYTLAAVILVAAAILISNGGRNVVYTGQATFLFVAGIYLAILARREVGGAAGVFIALIKPGFGIPLIVLLVALGRYRRTIAGTAAAASVSAVMMVPFIMWSGGLGPLWRTLTDNLAYSAESPWISLATTTARVDAAAAVASLFDVVPPGVVELSIGLGVLGVTAAVLLARRSHLDRPRVMDTAVVLICTAMLTATYHSFYDLPLLVLPTLLVARRDFADHHASQQTRWLLFGTFMIAAFNPFRIDMVQDSLSSYPRLVELLGPGLTGAAVLVAFVAALRLVWRLPGPNSIQKGSSDAERMDVGGRIPARGKAGQSAVSTTNRG